MPIGECQNLQLVKIHGPSTPSKKGASSTSKNHDSSECLNKHPCNTSDVLLLKCS